jgi:hypothetical protein
LAKPEPNVIEQGYLWSDRAIPKDRNGGAQIKLSAGRTLRLKCASVYDAGER